MAEDNRTEQQLPRETLEARVADLNGERFIRTKDFNPFAFTGIFRGLEEVRTGWICLAVLVIPAMMALCALISGVFGTGADFQVWADLQRILGIGDPPPAEPNFPLIRDVPTWLLTLAVMSGTVLLHRHWRHMSTCLSDLARNGVIVSRETPRSNVLSRILRVDAITSGASPACGLDVFVGRVTSTLHKNRAWILLTMLVSAIVLAYLLVLGEGNGLFQTIAPPDVSARAKDAWLNATYENWWAGESHVLSHVVYFVFAIVAVFVILCFQVVGIIAIYVAAGMQFLVEPSADWFNRDGRYGWAPLGRLYRTVMWAGALLGATLTVVLLSLGLTNFGWVVVLLASYVVLMPVFTVLPWLLFRTAARNALTLRIEQIELIMRAKGIDQHDIEQIAPYVAEIERCRTARIRPLRMGNVSFPTFITLVALPILLAAAQIVFPLRFGISEP
jgi:hypothetical protein